MDNLFPYLMLAGVVALLFAELYRLHKLSKVKAELELVRQLFLAYHKEVLEGHAFLIAAVQDIHKMIDRKTQ
jgi:hypothetical protein